MKEKLVKVGVVTATLGALALPFASHAAADPVIVNGAVDAAELLTDNAVGIMTNATYLGSVLGVIALFFAIRWAIRKVFGRGK